MIFIVIYDVLLASLIDFSRDEEVINKFSIMLVMIGNLYYLVAYYAVKKIKIILVVNKF